MPDVVDKIKAKVDEVLHHDKHHTTTGTHATGTHTTGTHHTGAVNDSYATTGTGNINNSATGTAGPHSSNIANKLDPRVDSDMDGSRNAGIATHGPGATHNAATGPARDTAGPHASNTLNKLDPRVDSDADGSRNAGVASHGPGGTHNNQYGSTNVGPHSSNLANKLDPRVDSDADGSRNVGAAQVGPGAHNTYNTGAGTDYGSSNVGPHSSNLANKLDPRVDSDADGSRNVGAAQVGPGAHNNYNTGAGVGGLGGSGAGYGSSNVGPHSSNLANKLDPRVDSDADGSRNFGAAQGGPGGANNPNTGAYGNNPTY